LKNIFIVCGSTRKNSTNHRYIELVKSLLGKGFGYVELDSLMNIPHFNPDDDDENVADAVKDFRNNLQEANGIIISTPEYAMGIPGSLKNAIDWTVSSSSFSKKPVLLITASSQGFKAHQALIDVLTVIEADTDGTRILIPFAKTKIDNENNITDKTTQEELAKAVQIFQSKL